MFCEEVAEATDTTIGCIDRRAVADPEPDRWLLSLAAVVVVVVDLELPTDLTAR